MRSIIYDFAMSLDGFICREDGSADGFVPEGDHVSEYLARLQQYETVIMGRKTYEFGYQYGLQPGERAYAHMDHHIFSSFLSFETDQVNFVSDDPIDVVREMKQGSGGPIYLCGGGALAGYLLQHDLIDKLFIKLNPILFGTGISPFGNSEANVACLPSDVKQYGNGVVLLAYDLASTRSH